MGKEIEHKFLTKSNAYRQLGSGTFYRQGYIPTLNGMTVRVRIAGTRAFVTFKDHAVGLTRHEFEYEVPVEEAQQMLNLMCSPEQIQKTRYIVPACDGIAPDGSIVKNLHWEIDEFGGENEGLVVAEIEVPEEGTTFTLPDWIGPEVTGDHRYYNSQLCKHPYKSWKND